MSIAEAALYGDLVKYLRDRWAEQAAQFNETSLAEEQKKIDELIKLEERQGLELERYTEEDALIFWWD